MSNLRYGIVTLLMLLTYSLFTQTISGELKTWHKITLDFTGPDTDERATPNPFMDYDLRVTFTNGASSYTVPGYFAADGDAAETSADAGSVWRAHFAPDLTGTWNYSVSFKTGTDVAVNGGGVSAGFMDGITGTFLVAATDKTGRDHRGKGRLRYVGEHYLQYAETGEWFLKAGADAPENTLAYDDFDEVPDIGGRRKNWQPHQQDYNAGEASDFTWQNGKGSELLGVVNYLSTKGVNAFSFLTFNVRGDDHNVFPHLYTTDITAYGGNNEWTEDLFHDRFDVSRMAQWERIFEYADQKGMFLHFKLQETENDDLMDGGDVGRERMIYYRELIARYSHHLALNWNMGEENVQSAQQRIDMAAYFDQNDPYDHLRVIHTYPGQKNQVYTPLLGTASAYTGASLQTSDNAQTQVFTDTKTWVENSTDAGKKWVIAVDEPGSASIGVDSDPDDVTQTRHRVVWGNFMAGGAGTEFYYGYQSGCGDLQCQDHRSRDLKYGDAAIALQFFQNHFQPYLPAVVNQNNLTADNADYVLSNIGNAYVVYRPSGGTTTISLPAGEWEVSWFNPRDGSIGSPVTISGNSISAPDNNDWVGLILPGTCIAGNSCSDGDPCTTDDVLDANCDCAGVFQDADQDGTCDAQDECPGFDNSLIGTSCDDGDAETINDVYTTACICAGIPPAAVTDFWLEAECATYGDMWQSANDINASEGAYLTTIGTATFFDTPPADEAYFIHFRVAVPQDGNYKIFARTFSSSDSDDSVWIRSGCGDWNKWNKINFPYGLSNFAWEQAADWVSGDSNTPVTFALEKGVNLIEVTYREPGIQLDKLYLTLEGVVPDGPGPATSNCTPACTPWSACDDGDPTTTGDTYDDNCECAGVTAGCAVLPVEWGDFSVSKLNDKDVLIEWSTLREENVLVHKVAKLTTGRDAEYITQIQAAGNTASMTNYHYIDRNVSHGEHFYRIVQFDIDGNQSSTPLRSIIMGKDAEPALDIYPNPTEEVFYINSSEPLLALILYDLSGRVISTFSPNTATSTYSVAGIPPGVYFLNARKADGQPRIIKLVIR